MTSNIKIKNEFYEKIINGKAYSFTRSRLIDITKSQLQPTEEALLTIEEQQERLKYLQQIRDRNALYAKEHQEYRENKEKIEAVAGPDWHLGTLYIDGNFSPDELREIAWSLEQTNKKLKRFGFWDGKGE